MTPDMALCKATWHGLLRRGRLIVTVLLVLFPALVGWLWKTYASSAPSDGTVYNVVFTSVILGFFMVLLAVVFGTGVVSQELDNRTIVYLLTRPIPRWRILLVRTVATTLALSLVVAIATVLLALVTVGLDDLGDVPLGRDLLVMPFGVLAYVSLFVFVSTVIERPLILGLFFVFGWEVWVPNMPGNFKLLSLMAYLRVLSPHRLPAESLDWQSFITALHATAISTELAWTVLLLVSVTALAAGCFVFSRREYMPREESA